MSNEINELREMLATVTTALTKGDVTDATIEALTLIPIRDAVLRFAFDNADQREALAENLQKLSEMADGNGKPVVHAVRAGVLWLDGKQDETVKEVSQALSADSTYSLARLLDVALRHGVPSHVWADSLSAVSTDECLTGAV